MAAIHSVSPKVVSGRRGLRLAVPAILAVLAMLASIGVSVPAASAAPATVVTLTFDDGWADQMTAVSTLKTFGLNGTFYVNSGTIGAPGFLTRADLAQVAANGNEVGGHTVSHPDLTRVPIDEAKRQICNDRATLSGWGYTVKSFAYPYAAYNASLEQVASDCGYNSARTLGDIASVKGCIGCPLAGPIPPVDPFNIPAVDMIDNTWTLAQMKAVVTNAEKVGGWVPFTFHRVCAGSGCDSTLSIRPALFTKFVAWLKKRPASTTVKTVDQVVGGPIKPVVSGPPASGSTTLKNPSLETADASGFPECWFPGGYGINTPVWTRADTGSHTGTYSQRLDMSGYSSGDAKLLPTFDLGACSPTISAGKSYNLSAWYKSTAVTQFALYYRDSAGGWYYWTSSPWFAAATDWTEATWITPAAPAGATGISFGLNLFSNGTLTTDDYALTEVGAGAASATQAMRAATTSEPDATRMSTGTQAALFALLPKALNAVLPNNLYFMREWARGDTASVPGGVEARPGTRVAIPFEPYR